MFKNQVKMQAKNKNINTNNNIITRLNTYSICLMRKKKLTTQLLELSTLREKDLKKIHLKHHNYEECYGLRCFYRCFATHSNSVNVIRTDEKNITQTMERLSYQRSYEEACHATHSSFSIFKTVCFSRNICLETN